MGPLFFPPLKLNVENLKFDWKKIRRLYFQFYFDTTGGINRFRLRAYAIGKKRRLAKDLPSIVLEVGEIKSPEESNNYYFPKEAPELVLGQLELSNVQIKKLIKGVSSGYLHFKPAEMKINPFCIVYDVTNTITSETAYANPCPPAPPPADNKGII